MSGSDPPSSPSSHGSFTLASNSNHQSDSRPPTPVRNIPINEVFEKRTLRKFDRRLLPVLGLVYALVFIDTTNFLVARQQGADHDLNLLVKDRYLFATGIFFVPVILFQLPLNLALRRVGPPVWIGTLAFLVGAALIWLAFVNNWQQFIAVRVILGLLEAVFLPSSVYLISCWYTRKELHTRVAYFYATSVFLGSFANILAFGLSKIHSSNTVGWRWIFIIQGILTILASPYGYSKVLPFPDKPSANHAPTFSRDEVHLMRQRVELDRRDYVPDPLTGAKVRAYLLDLKLWAFAFMALCAATGVFSYYLPATIPNEQDVASARAQLFFIPPGIFACIFTIIVGILSDRVNLRGPFIALNFVLSIVGLCMVAFTKRHGVGYAGSFLAYGGAQANIPTIFTYQANNIRVHSKRIYTVSLVAASGAAGGLIAAFTFPISAFPTYRAGLWVALALQVAGLCVAVVVMAAFWRTNARARWRPCAPPAQAPVAGPTIDVTVVDHADRAEEHIPAPPTPTLLPTTSPPPPAPDAQHTRGHRQPKIIEGLEGFTYTL